MRAIEQLRTGLSAIPGAVESRSRFGSGGRPAWRIREREFAHLHSDSLLDLRLPPAVQAPLRADPRAHFRRHPSAWLELEFHTAQDVVDLLRLAKQAATAAAQEAEK